jgi:methionyl aminopeptidase
MNEVLGQIKAGVKLTVLDKLAESLIEKSGGKPSFKMVSGYHWATCINVNQGVVHGIPTEYKLKTGDLVSVDMGFFYQGFHTDMARTLCVPRQDAKPKTQSDKFLEVGKKALRQATKAARVGNRVGHISQMIEKEVKKAGYSPVRNLTGHGLGRQLHEEPQIPCFLAGEVKDAPELKSGMVVAIEVIYTQGEPEVVLADDNWTVKTQDGSLAGLFENTVAVLEEGPVVLTRIG